MTGTLDMSRDEWGRYVTANDPRLVGAVVIITLIGIVVAGFLAVLLFGLVTRRIDWRAEGCCAPSVERDLRMRVPEDPQA